MCYFSNIFLNQRAIFLQIFHEINNKSQSRVSDKMKTLLLSDQVKWSEEIYMPDIIDVRYRDGIVEISRL